MAANQVGCAATNTPLFSTDLECLANSLIVGQAQVIVAAKVEQSPAIDHKFAPLRRFDQSPGTIQPLFFAL